MSFIYYLNDKHEKFKFLPILDPKTSCDSPKCIVGFCKYISEYKLKEVKNLRLNIAIEKNLVLYSRKSNLNPQFNHAVRKLPRKFIEELKRYLNFQRLFDRFYSQISDF